MHCMHLKEKVNKNIKIEIHANMTLFLRDYILKTHYLLLCFNLSLLISLIPQDNFIDVDSTFWQTTYFQLWMQNTHDSDSVKSQ